MYFNNFYQLLALISPQSMIVIGSIGSSFYPVLISNLSNASIPFTTFPKTTFLPSNQSVFFNDIKNYELFESFPIFAMLTSPFEV